MTQIAAILEGIKTWCQLDILAHFHNGFHMKFIHF
jgi:hypothetical protein